jgi:hypothetical protein
MRHSMAPVRLVRWTSVCLYLRLCSLQIVVSLTSRQGFEFKVAILCCHEVAYSVTHLACNEGDNVPPISDNETGGCTPTAVHEQSKIHPPCSGSLGFLEANTCTR